jgi:hypothetical protein
MSPSGTLPPTTWEKFMNLSTMTFNIKSTSDTTISFNQSITYRNGTSPWSGEGSIDIVGGEGAGVLFFIAAGLEAGNRIYPSSVNFTWTINSTLVDRSYWNGREVCVLNNTYYQPPTNNTFIGRRTVIYWDRLTGVLLSVFEEVGAYNSGSQVLIEGILLYLLIDNNVGIPMNYPKPMDMTPFYIILAFSLVVVIGVVIARVTTGAQKKKYKRLKNDTKV